MASKHFDHLLQAVEKNKVWFNKTFIQTFLPILIATLMLFVADLIAGGPKHLPNWFNWFMFIVFVSLITFSLVISQKRHLVGEYGETILILIPTFVWLVGGKFVAQHLLTIISFGIIIVGLILSAVSSLPFIIHRQNRERANFLAQLLMRLSFVCSTVTATVVISLILLNWADKTIHLAPQEINSETHEFSGDYNSTSWVMFIAIVTVASAALLVLIGLTHSISQEESKWKKLMLSFKNKLFSNRKNHLVEKSSENSDNKIVDNKLKNIKKQETKLKSKK